MKVKLYGSNSFTPIGSGSPGDEIQPRVAFPSLWNGQVGPYDNYAWRTDGDWCYGSYARDDFAALELDPSCCAGCKCGLTVIQDSDPNTGWDIRLNWANNKRILARVGHDLTSGALIRYVRIHVRFVRRNGGAYVLRPYYQVIGTQGDASAPFGAGATGFLAVSTGDSTTHFKSSLLNQNQYSGKLETSPVSGRPFDRDSLLHTAWGVWSEKASPNNNVLVWVSEMGVEVGYDESPYIVTTGTASPSSTSAVLRGSVDPKGDAGGEWFFEYGLTQFLGSSSPPVASPSSSFYNVELLLNGLTTETTYYYRLVARDSDGNLVYGAIKSFFTVSMCSTRPLLVL